MEKEVHTMAVHGVTFALSRSPEDCKNKAFPHAWVSATDILSIEPGVEEVYFGLSDEVKAVYGDAGIPFRLDMDDTQKNFPQVKKLTIRPEACDIRFPNSLFPNVEYVDASSSEYFESGNYLVRKWKGKGGKYHKDLYNAFCMKNGGTVDLDGINDVYDTAFDGCNAEHIKNANELTDGKAFAYAKFAQCRPGENVHIEDDNILTAVNAEAKSLDFPFGIRLAACKTKGVMAEKLSIHGMQTLRAVSCLSLNSVREIALEVEPGANLSDIQHDLRMAAPNAENVSTIGDCPDVRCIDGMLFTDNGRTLLYCPIGKKGDIAIPEGTVRVAGGAMCFVQAETITIPDTVMYIDENAFCSVSADTVAFSKGMASVNANSFQCAKIKAIAFPPNVISIGQCAFAGAKISKLTFSEGLEVIEDSAFSCKTPAEIRLPKSLMSIGGRNFRHAEQFTLEKDIRLDGLLGCIIDGINTASCVAVKMPGCTFAIPTKARDRKMESKLMEMWRSPAVSNQEMSEAFVAACNGLKDGAAKQDAMLEMAANGIGDGSLTYVKKRSSSMAKRYIKGNSMRRLQMLVDANAVTAKRLEAIIEKLPMEPGTEGAKLILENAKESAKK